MKYKKIRYLVEGDCEKHFLKENNGLKPPFFEIGKVEVFNVLSKSISARKIMTIERNTLLVFVFDTDKNVDLNVINENIKNLNKYKVNYIFVLQDKNFDDEILNSTDIKRLKDLFNCKRDSDFKEYFLKANNIFNTLKNHNFDIGKFWIYKNKNNHFEKFISQGELIKKKH